MISRSPLDDHLEQVMQWRALGLSNAQQVRKFSEMGIMTSEGSIRRALRRGNYTPIPESEELSIPLEWFDAEQAEVQLVKLKDSYKPRKELNEWGYGPAELVRPATFGASESVVFLCDMHFPYHDPAVIQSAIDLVRRLQPDRVVLNGDICDFFQLSRFNKAGERLDTLQAEIDMGVTFRRAIRAAAPNAVIDENEGNHDNRIRTFVEQNARALTSLRALDPQHLFGYDELEINWHPGAGFLLREQFLVKHGTLVRGEGGASAKAELLQAGISGISGHVHRLCTYRRAGYTQRQWTEGGGLMSLKPDYVTGVPNWCQGAVAGEFSTTSNSFVIYEIPVMDGKLAPFNAPVGVS